MIKNLIEKILVGSRRMCSSVLLLILLWPAASVSLPGVDFTYDGADGRITYRFIPRSGTLHDLTVVYNRDFQFFPAYYGGITAFNLGGKEYQSWDGEHEAKLLEEYQSGGSYQARFRWSRGSDRFEFTVRLRLDGKTLAIEFFTDPTVDNVAEFGLDRSEQTPAPRVVYLPYGHNVLFSRGIFVSAVIDPLLSNASVIEPVRSHESATSARYAAAAFYHPLTDGSRNPLRETVYLAVSPDIEDTFFPVANPVSPYRELLAGKVVVDLWRTRFEQYKDDLQRLVGMGMTDIFALIHVWQKYGYDNGLPTTYPASEAHGGEQALLEVVDLCEARDYLVALHTNYVDFYENSDVWNSGDVALDSDGRWLKAWYNASTGIQSYLMKPSRVGDYARLYEPLIHEAYRTSAAFLDVHSSILPSYKVDYDAAAEGAGLQLSTLQHYRDLFDNVRDVHQGPVAGEGTGTAASIWAGYVDAMEADPRSSHGIGGSDVPLLLDYKLKILHPLFVPHGAGYLERFYLDKWNGYSREELERYRVTEIAFANAGFLSNPFAKGIGETEILRDYCFLKHLQRFYLEEVPQEILYLVEERLLTLSAALKVILPQAPAEDLDRVLNEELSMVKIVFSGGFILYVNRSGTRSWGVTENGIHYTLPANGFLAIKGNEFLAYTAVVDGVRKYYAHPKEPACCRVVAPLVNFSGRRLVNRSFFQTEYMDELNWETYPGNTDISKYSVFRVEGENRTLLAELDADTFSFRHRRLEQDRVYTYALVATAAGEIDQEPAFTTVGPIFPL